MFGNAMTHTELASHPEHTMHSDTCFEIRKNYSLVGNRVSASYQLAAYAFSIGEFRKDRAFRYKKFVPTERETT